MIKSIAFPADAITSAKIKLLEEACIKCEGNLQVVELLEQNAIVLTITAKSPYLVADIFYFIGGLWPYQAFTPFELPTNLIMAELMHNG